MDRSLRAVVTNETGTVLVDKSKTGGTGNVGELWAISEALTYCKAAGIRHVEIRSDSRIALSWLYKRHMKSTHLAEVKELLQQIKVVRRDVAMDTTWIPREENLAGQVIENSQKQARLGRSKSG
jgi:ribonuclease HI